MFFRNLTFFTIADEALEAMRRSLNLGTSDSGFVEALRAAALKPVGALEMQSRGFVSPFGRGEEAMCHVVGTAVWLTLGSEDKILPAVVVNDALGKKIAEFEEREGRKLGGKARKRLKEDLVHELLPRAFTKPGRLDAYIDLKLGFIAIDTSSRKSAECFITELRHALGSLPAMPLNPELSVRSVLTAWVAGEEMPDGLALGEDVDLKDTIDGGATAKLANQELHSDEVTKHLESGKQASRLAVVADDHVSFTLGEDLVLRKVKFLDGAVDQLENTERDSLHAELDARFALMSGEVGRLFTTLAKALKFTEGKELPEPAPRPKVEPRVTITVTAGDDEADPLYPAAVSLVVSTQRASISGVQRQLKLGYNRAVRLIEAMEAAGIVSPPASNGDRTVLKKG